MTTKVIKGHKRSPKKFKSSFLVMYFCLTPNLFEKFQEYQHYEDEIIHKMKYDLKCHPKSYKTTFMPKYFWHIRLWTNFDQHLYEY